MRKFWAKFREVILIACCTYLAIEGVCAAFLYSEYIPTPPPSFSTDLFSDVLIADVSSFWGVWHPYRSVRMQKAACFDLAVHYNQYGARDKERAKNSTSERVVVLGDSFMEGYGLEEKDRLSNRLEDSLQKEVLNFACFSMNPTQYTLVYQKLAKDFMHNTVIIGLYPGNDFIDADINIQKKLNYQNYKPYWDENCQLFYWVDSLQHSPYSAQKIKGWERTTVRVLKNFTYWFNIFYFLKYIKPHTEVAGNGGDVNRSQTYSGFYDYTAKQYQQLTCSLKSLTTTASQKKIILFTIPNATDIARFEKEKRSKLGEELTVFCQETGILFVDLLPITYQEKRQTLDKLFIPCDGHWSAEGNAYAVEKLLPLLQENTSLPAKKH